MIRNIYIIIIIIIIICITRYNFTIAQTYQIKSFEGNTVNVKLSYKMFSKRLSVSCLKDTIYLSDYTSTKRVHIVNNKFLQIDYSVLGGIGIINRNTLILSFKRNKIIISMLINSHFEGVSAEKHILYDVKLNQILVIGHTFKITASITDKIEYYKNPKTNFALTKQVNLNFDPSDGVFYSTFEYLSRSFSIIKSDCTNAVIRKSAHGKFPKISFDKTHNYLYLDNCWYLSDLNDAKSKTDTLDSYSYR